MSVVQTIGGSSKDRIFTVSVVLSGNYLSAEINTCRLACIAFASLLTHVGPFRLPVIPQRLQTSTIKLHLIYSVIGLAAGYTNEPKQLSACPTTMVQNL